MPATTFICPDRQCIFINQCLMQCSHGKRCMFLPAFRAIAKSLNRKIKEPTVTELIAGGWETDDEVLLSVEKICPSIPLMELNIEAIPDDYLNVQLRAEKYTPWVRGNIIYFRNLLGNIEYRDTELKNRVHYAKSQLKSLLVNERHALIYGRTAFEVTSLIPQIIRTFDTFGISATPGYRSVKIHSVLGIQTDIEMSNEDIIFSV